MKQSANITVKYIKLLFWSAAIVAAAFWGLPALERIPAVEKIVESNRKYSVEADALFYTEIDEFGEASNYMNNSNNTNR